ncbi:unnamed protein product [Calypogeia fissa]
MAVDDETMIADDAKTDHEAHATLADASAQDSGISRVDNSEVQDQKSSSEPAEARAADTAVAEPQDQNTTSTSTSTSVVSSGKTGGGGGKSTLAQLILEDSVTKDRTFKEELPPISEITEIPIEETPERLRSETAVAADRQGRLTLRQLLDAEGKERREAADRNPDAESSTATTALTAIVASNKTAEKMVTTPPISVILFGRTGSGKSTLAQMLTIGNLDPDSERFVSSSGIRGETKELKVGEGRGWRVVDTPGFGEPRDQHSTISSDEAEWKIKQYIQMIEGTYTHCLYTVMRDRIDELDKKLWKFFVRLFGDSIGTNFTIVISNASTGWLDQNRADLAASFKGCDSFLSAEFPPLRNDDEEWEMELADIRQESLKQLEDELAKLGRLPVECSFVGGGFFASSGASLKKMAKTVIDKGYSGISGVVKSILQISGLMDNGRFLLVPQFSCGNHAAIM